MDLEKIISQAKKKYFSITNDSNHMDIDFFLNELFQFIPENKDFLSYFAYCIGNSGVSLKEIEKIPVSFNKYIETYKLYIDGLTETRKENFLQERTRIYNNFILFLITQIKLVSNNEEFFAVLLTIQYFGKNTIPGIVISQHNISRDEIIEEDQKYRLEKLRNQVKSKDLTEEINKEIESETNNQEGLSKFFVDYSTYLKEFKPTKLVGRTQDIENIEQSLFRKNKCGVALVGKSGVGKDEIVNAFTTNIKHSKFFNDYTIIKIDTSALSEVNIFRGHLEAKINELLSYLAGFTDVILYVEDIHNLFNKIRVDDDIAHVLLPGIMKYRLKCIVTCDYSEWTSIVEDNKQITKYFQKIMVEETSPEETVKILSKNSKSYEQYYGIKYNKDVFETVVSLADRYMFNTCFPEKAIDVLDIISSKFKYNNISAENPVLTSAEVNKLFGEVNNIPLDDINEQDLIDFKKIANNLKNIVISQDEAIDKIMDHIAINKAGLREDNKTVCNIFLKAQSGVGKTFLCQELAKQLHVKLIRFDMSEYSEQHSVAKFLGTPPGYVGFSDANHGSLLISALEQNPRCVLLLDEIEKANETIHNVLLQAMDNGKITSTTGKEVSLKEVVLVMTSNVGATATDAIAFGESSKDNAMEHMDQIFKPEFKTRLDDIITLNPVSKIDVKKVIEIELNKIKPMIKKYKKKLSWSKDVVKYIEKQVLNNNLGLRIVKHIIDTEIKIQIVENLNKTGNLTIQLEDDKLKVKLCN